MKIRAAVVSANAASTLLGGHRRLHFNGAALNHHTGVSCFAEYAVVSRRSSVRIEAGITHLAAAIRKDLAKPERFGSLRPPTFSNLASVATPPWGASADNP